MPQVKRGPKAKPKVAEPVMYADPVNDGKESFSSENRSYRMWALAGDLLLQKAKLASSITPAAIAEIANQVKALDRELNG